MAKRKFRIDTGYYGGETVIGEVSNEFVKKAISLDEGELVDTVLSFDDWGGDDELDENAEHDDPEQIPSPRDEYYMWECDDIEHINSAYGDSEMTVFEVPADGSDDYDYDNELGNFTAIHMYGREGGYFGNEEPDVINEDDDEGNHYVPVLAFHSCEKGTFASYFVETDGEDFDQYKLGMGINIPLLFSLEGYYGNFGKITINSTTTTPSENINSVIKLNGLNLDILKNQIEKDPGAYFSKELIHGFSDSLNTAFIISVIKEENLLDRLNNGYSNYLDENNEEVVKNQYSINNIKAVQYQTKNNLNNIGFTNLKIFLTSRDSVNYLLDFIILDRNFNSKLYSIESSLSTLKRRK